MASFVRPASDKGRSRDANLQAGDLFQSMDICGIEIEIDRCMIRDRS